MAATAASRSRRRSACPVIRSAGVSISSNTPGSSTSTRRRPGCPSNRRAPRPRSTAPAEAAGPRGIPRDGRAVPDATAPPSAHVAAHQHARHAGVANPGMSASATSTARVMPGRPSKCRAAVARLVPMPSPAGSASITRQSSARSSAASAALPGAPRRRRCPRPRSRRALATATHGPVARMPAACRRPAAARRSANPARRRQQDAGT